MHLLRFLLQISRSDREAAAPQGNDTILNARFLEFPGIHSPAHATFTHPYNANVKCASVCVYVCFNPLRKRLRARRDHNRSLRARDPISAYTRGTMYHINLTCGGEVRGVVLVPGRATFVCVPHTNLARFLQAGRNLNRHVKKAVSMAIRGGHTLLKSCLLFYYFYFFTTNHSTSPYHPLREPFCQTRGERMRC